MTEGRYLVEYNRPLTADVWEMRLAGDTGAITAPGQFINLRLEGLFLRRPISICDWDGTGLTILYKVVGKGTAALAAMEPGRTLDGLCGLGNGFDIAKCGERTLLIGGGVGVPPLYGLAKALLAAGKTPVALLGFNTQSEVFYEEAFRSLGARGLVTDCLPEAYDYFCACGPLPMLRAVWGAAATSGLLSFEERMGCGFGACMGCSCETKYGSKRICRDGPVLEKEEILW